MIKILFIAPYKELEILAKNTFLEYAQADVRLEAIQAVGVNGIQKLELDYDVVIARGVTATSIVQNHKDLPVIELPVTGFDVLRAVYTCKNRFSPRKIALIGGENMFYGVQTLEEFLDIEMICLSVDKEEAAEASVRQATSAGAEVIIGGVMTARIADRYNIPNMIIESGKEAICQALDIALNTARVRQREQERSERFRTIMDYAHEGIIAIDKEGHIAVFNKTAQNLTQMSTQDALGSKIEKLLPGYKLKNILERGNSELGVLQKFNNTTTVSNLVPIQVRDEIVGAVATIQDISEIQALEGRIRKQLLAKGHVAKYTFADLIGHSEPIRETIDMAKRYSQVDSSILIIGETGTGKELIAQSIHNASARNSRPFIAVNCAALPASLLESELFGYSAGAFTGAAKGGKAGLFELAHTGTIFLDEIGEISHDLQCRLLRVLQEQEIMRIGDSRVMPIDVRVISATNVDLELMVEQGRFRRDLLYRLNVLNINVPALNERQSDILDLLDHFLEHFNRVNQKKVQLLEDTIRQSLKKYPWPGNIRELKNFCERLVVLNDDGPAGQATISQALTGKKPGKKLSEKRNKKHVPLAQNKNDLEREMILNALRETGNNKAEAARILGLSRTTIWRKLKDMGITVS